MTPSQELRYATERDRLLDEASLHHGRCHGLPALALEDILEMLGYQIEYRLDVPAPVTAFCQFETRRVIVAEDLASRLTYPQSAPGVIRSNLAHELGHIVLHSQRALKGIVHKCWEEQAHDFAMVFLMPREAVLSRPQVRILQRGWVQETDEIWTLVADLAQEFLVNGSFMARALVAYGVITMNRKTRVMRPCVVAAPDSAEVAA